MAHGPHPGSEARPARDLPAVLLRLTARVIGALAAGLWLLVLFLGLLAEGTEALTFEGALLVLLMVLVAAAVAAAFRYEMIGGVTTLAVGCTLAVFAVITANRNQLIAVLVAGVPFIVSGLLFVASTLRRRSTAE